MDISYTKPKIIEGNIFEYIINAFITYNDGNKTYSYVSTVVGNTPSYDNIVSALINYKYTYDQVTAITLNYLLTLHEEVLEPEKVKEYQQDYK